MRKLSILRIGVSENKDANRQIHSSGHSQANQVKRDNLKLQTPYTVVVVPSTTPPSTNSRVDRDWLLAATTLDPLFVLRFR